MADLNRQSLHSSVREPALESIGFLNEVMGRFPDAISFAPGAPNLEFVRGLDTASCVDRYVDHVAAARGWSIDRVRPLLYEYGPSRGLINDLVADALRRDYAIDVAPEALVITVGAQEAMFLALRALFRPRDLLAVVNPSFVGITGAARLLDIDVVGIPDTEHGIDVDHLEATCAAARAASRRVAACYVAPDFANPSGSRMAVDARHRLLALAERADFLVLEDNVYGFTAEPGSERPALKSLDPARRVVHIGTFAKVCFPGARVGFVVADQRVARRDGPSGLLADEIAALKTMVTVNTSPICQAVIGGMLLQHGGSLSALSRGKCALYRRNLGRLLDALDRHLSPGRPAGVTWNRPDGGFFVLMHLPIRADTALLEVAASKFGVLWTPMAPFYLDGTGDNVLRLSCSYLDPDRIETGVGRLTEFVTSVVG